MLDDMGTKANAGEVPEGIEAAPATTSSSEHVTEPLPSGTKRLIRAVLPVRQSL